jgi:hypothetical protein
MAVKSNSFQITFFSEISGKKVVGVLQSEPDFSVCFSEALGLPKVDTELPVDLEQERRYAAVTLVIADGVHIEKARRVAQRLQLSFDHCTH